jgi:hypothetical protein
MIPEKVGPGFWKRAHTGVKPVENNLAIQNPIKEIHHA